MEGWIGLAHLYAFFVVLWSTLRQEKWWKMLFETLLAVSILEGVYGLLQLNHAFAINQGGVRVDGTFGNAIYFGVFMLFSLFITGFLYLHYRKESFTTAEKSIGAIVIIAATVWLAVSLLPAAALSAVGWSIFILFLALGIGALFLKRQWFYGAAMVLQAVMIFNSATRSAILGVIVGLFVAGLALLFFSKTDKRLKQFGIGAIVAVILLIGGLFVAKDTPLVQNHPVLARVSTVFSPSELQTRLTLLPMALRGIAERPILGWGQENYSYIFNKYYEPTLYGQEAWFDRAHNQFIDVLVAGGILSFLPYISLFVLALWYIWRKPRNKPSSFSDIERGLLTGLLAAYTFNDIFVFDNLLSYILFFAFLAYLAYRAETDESILPSGASSWEKPVSPGVFAFSAPVIAGVMIAVFYFANVPGIATAYNLIEALKPHQEGLSANIAYLKTAESATGLGRQEAREQGIQFYLQAKAANIGDANFQNSVAALVGSPMADEVAKNPTDTRLHVFFGSFLRQTGQIDNALTELTRAQELSPKKQQIMFELGILESVRGNADGALGWFKKAYELEPAYDTARFLYAATLLRTGQAGMADSLLKERFGTTTPDSDILLQAYIDIKDYPHVIAMAEARVAADPANTKKRIQLAAAYLESGNRAGAVKALQDAILSDPSFKAQGESYIQTIQAGKNP
jgi:cytochrome c-type biogenesis protein CcmH/NrfG